ncbi:cell division protein FtsK [Pseudonocardia sp. EC080610-09]|uniref:FtsK/SpoIIIE domain-containing protein n=1 Tax=unclassified Pseudonocardia TaxID=2619320 RepID=UPI0006CB774D|nr:MULTISPECIES: FtsK/SpoIIIE domain-containing protein [unclassified Pseudonocardia]ALE72360.1 cell division protein FtsK [Pseudonocardia sp. EC080625-04]ALL75653.1 cell division protein FtsK [Pseudonocardia sp. EC080610-09]ALL82680.1 cell division protein FtsK [Pseudonocardia sp. EC080619-01]
MARRRERIRTAFQSFHSAASAALGAAEVRRDRAAAAHAEAMAELWLRETGHDAAQHDPGLAPVLANPRLAGVVARVAEDRAHAFDGWQDDSPQALSDIVAGAAPGAAGDDPSEWKAVAGRAEAVDGVPEMWALGTGSVEGGTPFRVAVPLLDGAHLQVVSSPRTRERAESMVEQLVLRLLRHYRPGVVNVHVWDVGQLAGALPGLYPLTRTGLLTVHDPTRLESLLSQLADRIRRVQTRVLAAGCSSLAELAGETGTRPESWMVAVLVGNGRELPEAELRQLQRVARGGIAAGVVLVLLDVPVGLRRPVEAVDFGDPPGTDPDDVSIAVPVRTSLTGPHVLVEPDAPVPPDDVTKICTAIAAAHEEWRGRLGAFADLLPAGPDRGRDRSHQGLVTEIGFSDGMPSELVLDDHSPHALVGGPSGSGKTNLLLAWISGLAARYGPDEVELYLLDFKEGVSFTQFAPDPDGHRPDRLPQARLIGVNINTDREFGLALLRHLSEVMRSRAEAARRHGATKLSELRDELADRGITGPEARLPRIVAVVDEFQFLFTGRDAVSAEATALLEDVARRGRSQGVHLVLASQDISGIDALWGRSAIFEQFVLRIALPRARRILAQDNEAALEIPRWHAVVNHDSGVEHGNRVVRVPEAGAPLLREVQRTAFETFPDEPDPVVFDGARAPAHEALAARLPDDGVPRALVGQFVDVHGSPAAAGLADGPGRNLGVIGPDARAAVPLLCAAVESYLAALPGDDARVVLVPLAADAGPAADELAGRLRADVEKVAADGFAERVRSLAATVRDRTGAGTVHPPLAVVLFGADVAEAMLDRTGTEDLRAVLRHGPGVGVHVLGWWQGAQRLKTLLAPPGAAIDDLGAWVATGVQGADLVPLLGGQPLDWMPSPGRALFLDRARHSRPQLVILTDRGGGG